MQFKILITKYYREQKRSIHEIIFNNYIFYLFIF